MLVGEWVLKHDSDNGNGNGNDESAYLAAEGLHSMLSQNVKSDNNNNFWRQRVTAGVLPSILGVVNGVNGGAAAAVDHPALIALGGIATTLPVSAIFQKYKSTTIVGTLMNSAERISTSSKCATCVLNALLKLVETVAEVLGNGDPEQGQSQGQEQEQEQEQQINQNKAVIFVSENLGRLIHLALKFAVAEEGGDVGVQVVALNVLRGVLNCGLRADENFDLKKYTTLVELSLGKVIDGGGNRKLRVKAGGLLCRWVGTGGFGIVPTE